VGPRPSLDVFGVEYVFPLPGFEARAIELVLQALYQGWRTYGTRKDFVGTRHSVLFQIFYFFFFTRPLSLYCDEHVRKYSRVSF